MRTAVYARYSTELQRDASLDDQIRNVRGYCARQSWCEPVIYVDAAVSGSREDRPQYRKLLADAAERFDVVLVDDLSRLSRDKDECGKALKRLMFAGVRVIGVSDGVDTAAKGHKVNAGLRGLMSELYLDDLAEKTHRGLTGRAIAGASAGGLAFGYRVQGIGVRAIDDDQATVVRRIYADFIAHKTPRAIAAALNLERVPPPRGSTWCMSAIYGDNRRGIGILANPIYVGRQIWNRSRWVKHPDSGRRLRKERPQSEWIITEHPELAIVDAATWAAAQAQIRASRSKGQGGKPGGPGRPARHVFSGILRCPACAGPMVIIDRYRYGCATHKDRGPSVCANAFKIARDRVEPVLLAGIREQLLSDAVMRRNERDLVAMMKTSAPDLDAVRSRIASAERVHANIVAALRAGIITPTTRAELITAETQVAAAKASAAEAARYQPAQIIPRARERWRALVADLEHARDVHELRSAVQALIGQSIVLREESGEVFAEIDGCQINMVAGARSVLYLTEPLRITIPRKPGRA